MKSLAATIALALLFVSCRCDQDNTKTFSFMDQDHQVDTLVMKYPNTKKDSIVENHFGTMVPDPYRWLEGNGDDVKDWVVEQNKVTDAFLEMIPFRAAIKDRLDSIWNYPKFGAPFKRGDNYFYYYNEGTWNQSALMITSDADKEGKVFLDPNKFSEEGTTSLSAFSVSKDGKYAVYGTSEGGSDWNEYKVVEIPSAKETGDHLKWIKFSGAAWKDDGFFYGRFPEPTEGDELSSANENKQIYYHKLGTDQSEDQLVFEDRDRPKLSIYAQTTDDERFLVLYLSQGATRDNALFVKDLSDENGEIVKIVEHFNFNYDVIDNIDGKLLVMTNDNAPRKRVVLIDPANPAPDQWEEIVGETKEVLESVSLAGDKMILEYLADANSRLYAYNLSDFKMVGEIELPDLGTVGGFSGKKGQDEAFFTFTSFVYPSTTFRYKPSDNSSTEFRKSKIDFDPSGYETKQVFFRSKDNTQVPMFIVHKKGIELDGNNPTMLYGYGGFNINILPGFRITNIPLLENGGIYVSVTLRGGGEYGEEWHKEGMLLKKQNVFDDFIGAAEWLIENKYTSPERLAIHGGSNGGLLVGAAMCQRPELFKVALPAVGVMDMLRYHKFTIGHAWAVEYGDPDEEVHFNNVFKFSPVHNLKNFVNYPATMVLTADHDDRVVPAHSYKFIATLQEKHKGTNPVLIRIETMAGHGAGKPTDKIIEEAADKWAFVFYNMNVKPGYSIKEKSETDE